MSIAEAAIGEVPIVAQKTAVTSKVPPKRRIAAAPDAVAVAERR